MQRTNKMKEKYKLNYSIGIYHILANVCTADHYFGVFIIFNSENRNVFESVKIYDSLRYTVVSINHSDAMNKQSTSCLGHDRLLAIKVKADTCCYTNQFFIIVSLSIYLV
jgi:hypothetical protein